jgi:hypothetical protein
MLSALDRIEPNLQYDSILSALDRTEPHLQYDSILSAVSQLFRRNFEKLGHKFPEFAIFIPERVKLIFKYLIDTS